MKVLMTKRRGVPDTANGDSFIVSYVYTGTKAEIDKIESEYKEKISEGSILITVEDTNSGVYIDGQKVPSTADRKIYPYSD